MIVYFAVLLGMAAWHLTKSNQKREVGDMRAILAVTAASIIVGLYYYKTGG